jgi:hypothetical protein
VRKRASRDKRCRTSNVTPFADAAVRSIVNDRHVSRREVAATLTATGDLEKFRAELASEMLRVGRKLLAAIERDIDTMKPESRAFALCAVTDKAHQLQARLATNGATARVQVQINSFGPEGIDRRALLAALSGDVSGMALASRITSDSATATETTVSRSDAPVCQPID